ncbi:MAG: hypothetical protein M3460_08120 [Actinomycetota bacterium]|jgi:hypothetical protein|nr:hypothetical protein [Actinomycetota bacterium]
MSAVIVIEIVVGIVVLAAAVRFAIRETRRRSGAGPEQQSGPEHTGEEPARDSDRQEQPVNEAAD